MKCNLCKKELGFIVTCEVCHNETCPECCDGNVCNKSLIPEGVEIRYSYEAKLEDLPYINVPLIYIN